MNKIISIHQPNYLPWLGYFYKIANCDVFVYLDTVQYPRGQSFAARNKIKTANGPTYLTIPVSGPGGKKGKALYTEISFADKKWQTKHLKTIELNYKKSAYFEEIFNLFKTHLELPLSFTDLNISLIEAFVNYLEIKTKRVRLSEILQNFGQKSEMIIDICKTLEGDTYFSGNGSGRKYNDDCNEVEKVAIDQDCNRRLRINSYFLQGKTCRKPYKIYLKAL